jgi:hypothetical protein
MLDALYFIILMEIFPFTISISFPVNYTDVLHQRLRDYYIEVLLI